MVATDIQFIPSQYLANPSSLRDLSSFDEGEIKRMEEGAQLDWLIAQSFAEHTYKDVNYSPYGSDDIPSQPIMRFFAFGPLDFEPNCFELMEYLYNAGNQEYHPKRVNFTYQGLLARISHEGFERKWEDYIIENRIDNWREGRSVKIILPKYDFEIGPDRPTLSLGKAFIFTKLRGW